MNIKELLKKRLARADFVGDINGKLLVHPVYLNSEEFGESTEYPTVLEIKIQNEHDEWFLDNLKEASKIVRNKYFDYDFLFNVSFSCAKPDIFGDDLDADPYSIWFNVFFGYYQIDIPQPSARNYPFGFNPDLTLNPEEILKIGKSDWNYFSNFCYGVPLNKITNEVTDIYPEELEGCEYEEIYINGVKFYKLTVNSFRVISAYEADNDITLNREEENLLWQALFGFPKSRKEFKKSFFPVSMKAVMYIYHKKIQDDYDVDGEELSTFIFGGTINIDYPENALKNPANDKTKEELEVQNERFLSLQLQEIEKIIPKVLDI
jgi:hypothetical protein